MPAGVKEMGRLLQRRREELQLSQAEIADRLDVSQSYISKWELGGNRKITLDSLRKLARAYEMDIDVLSRAAGYALPVDLQPPPADDAVTLARTLPPDLSPKQREMIVTYAWWVKENYWGEDASGAAT